MTASKAAWRIVPMAGADPAQERKVVTDDGELLGRIYKDRKYWIAVIGGYTAVSTSMNLAVVRARGNAADAAQAEATS